MELKTFKDIEQDYELEIERVIKEIKKQKATRILVQFPDCLKPYASAISDEIKKRLNKKMQIFIWLGSCFGACDTPIIPKEMKIDLLIQFGHTKFFKEN